MIPRKEVFFIEKPNKYMTSYTVLLGLLSLLAPLPVVQGGLGPNNTTTIESSVVATDISFPAPIKVTLRTITAYSSTPEETDDTPFITASGKHVHEGTIAANWLPFGAKVKIPELFGERIFTVEDRMHRRHNTKLDIWFPSKEAAIKFGVQIANVEVL